MNSLLYLVDSISDLNGNYNGISKVIQVWFTNNNGLGKMESKGFGERNKAFEILIAAINDHKGQVDNN